MRTVEPLLTRPPARRAPAARRGRIGARR